jgi:hypothetical protein
MISGAKVNNPTKTVLVQQISEFLGIATPSVSNGSSVDSAFLDEVISALGGSTSSTPIAYRKTEKILDLLGMTYDPFWDTSEATRTGGGSTVTNRGYSRILAALTKTPRCFLLSVTDAPVGARWEVNHEEVYRYDNSVTGRKSLNDAGPGSKVIYYATRRSSMLPMHFIAVADVDYIFSNWEGPWEARLTNFQHLEQPIPSQSVQITGRNQQHAITEISFDTYKEIVDLGRTPDKTASPSLARRVRKTNEHLIADPGSDIATERISNTFNPDEMQIEISIPNDLPVGLVKLAEPHVPSYVEIDSGLSVISQVPMGSGIRDRDRNKRAEERAIDIAIRAMTSKGWQLSGDKQSDGVGYDLEFKSGTRELHIEVKGIQGADLTFNLTPKETWRTETDDNWAVIAVTSVLSPQGFQVHFITREQLQTARRTILGYRIALESRLFE